MANIDPGGRHAIHNDRHELGITHVNMAEVLVSKRQSDLARPESELRGFSLFLLGNGQA